VTFLRAAGVTPPKTWIGRDLMPTLSTTGRSDITDAMVEWADDQSETFGKLAYRQIRTPTHKLIVFKKSDRPSELYDLVKDRGETKNLIDDPALADVKKDLMHRLRHWLRKGDDPAIEWMK
jgi:arylsulfatase A-like enzyme